MLNTTKKIIQTYYDSFNKGDMDKFLSLLADDVIHDISQGGREVGKEKFAKFMEAMNKYYHEQAKDLIIMVSDDGKRAAAEFVIDGKYLVTAEGLPEANGQKYSLACGAFFEINNGKVQRISNHYNIKDWLKQVS